LLAGGQDAGFDGADALGAPVILGDRAGESEFEFTDGREASTMPLQIDWLVAKACPPLWMLAANCASVM
jgi:hypothetical protein